MVFTTPVDRANDHQTWHHFKRGLCLNCGWYCQDCPVGVATCRCTKEEIDARIEKYADKRLKEENSGATDSWSD